MKFTKIVLTSFLLLSNIIVAQKLSISAVSGVKSLVGNSYYSQDIGWPGMYEINGTRSWFTGLGFRNELNLGIALDYKFTQMPIGLALNFNYSPMRGKGIWPSWDLNNPESPETYGEVESKMDLYSLGAGCKYFFPINKFEPYLSISALMNYFGDVKIYSSKYGTENFVNDYGIRYGLSAGAGLNYELPQLIIINGSIAFEMNNLINVRNGEDKLNTLIILVGAAYNIL